MREPAPIVRGAGRRAIGHAPPGIRDARRPAARVGGVTLGEATARVATKRGISTKLLNFLDSGPREQVITGRQKRIGNDFQHQRGSGADRGQHIGSLYVLIKSHGLGIPKH
jgi:hypothetical protein